MIKICPKCNAEHEKDGIFCTRKCANSRIFSQESRDKKSKSNLAWHIKNKNKVDAKKCIICNSEFYGRGRTCSKICVGKYISIVNKGKTGGYREHSGRAKTGYYKGIYCGSTYELVWIIYRIDHNLLVKRFDGYLQKDKLKYFPDFIDEFGRIIEIKGYKSESVDNKSKLAEECGYEINVLYLENLREEFKWVKENYTYNSIIELYDEYKPKYIYYCDNCNKEYNRERLIKTKLKFCSRTCCALYGAKKRCKSKV